jgi:superoxide dismutase, Cu-Zn family
MIWNNSNTKHFGGRMAKLPADATAKLTGSPAYPSIQGTVSFYKTMRGVLVAAEVFGLPQGNGKCSGLVFGCHIHEGKIFIGNGQDPFADTKGHYNPDNCLHPRHAGDLPPLFGNRGYAWSAVLTDRFTLQEIIGRTVIVHRNPDDFTSQPSGNSGEKIACGVIEP